MYTQCYMYETHNPTVFTCQGPFCIFIVRYEEPVYRDHFYQSSVSIHPDQIFHPLTCKCIVLLQLCEKQLLYEEQAEDKTPTAVF